MTEREVRLLRRWAGETPTGSGRTNEPDTLQPAGDDAEADATADSAIHHERAAESRVPLQADLNHDDPPVRDETDEGDETPLN